MVSARSYFVTLLQCMKSVQMLNAAEPFSVGTRLELNGNKLIITFFKYPFIKNYSLEPRPKNLGLDSITSKRLFRLVLLS